MSVSANSGAALVAGVLVALLAGCPASGPRPPSEIRDRYPPAQFVCSVGCPGEKSIEALKTHSRAALKSAIRQEVEKRMRKVEETAVSLGLPERFCKWPARGTKDPAPLYESLIKTNINTHWADEKEGSCMLACLERQQAGWILERECERSRRQFADNLGRARTAAQNLVEFTPPFLAARRSFRYLLSCRSQLAFISDEELDGWDEMEGGYVELLFQAADLMAASPLMLSVHGEIGASRLATVSAALEEAAGTFGVATRGADSKPQGFVLDVTAGANCRGEPGVECCLEVSGRLLSAESGAPVAECNLSPAGACASQGTSRERSMEALFGSISARPFQEPLKQCLSLILPFD